MLPGRKENHHICNTWFQGPVISLSLWWGFNFSQGWHIAQLAAIVSWVCLEHGLKHLQRRCFLPTKHPISNSSLCFPVPAKQGHQPGCHFSFCPFPSLYKVAALSKEGEGAQTRAAVLSSVCCCVCVVFWNWLNICEGEFNQKRKYKQSGCILLQSTIFKAGRHLLNEKTFSSYQWIVLFYVIATISVWQLR